MATEHEVQDDMYARFFYDEFRIKQPHVETDGLWEQDGYYYIKCTNLSEKPIGENPLGLQMSDFFDRVLKPIGTPVFLVEQVPEEATRVCERSLDEVIQLTGTPLNVLGMENAILLEVPKGVPLKGIEIKDRRIIFEFTSNPSETDIRSIEFVLKNRLKLPNLFTYEMRVVSQPSTFSVGSRGLHLIPSQLFGTNLSKHTRTLLEEDEEYWVDKRYKLFGETEVFDQDLELNWRGIGSRGFVDATMSHSHPDNIRNYLSIFETVILAAPMAGSHHQVLQSLGVTEEELTILVREGRIKLVFPMSIDRYDLDFVERVAAEKSPNLLLSRKLACLTVLDTRKRNPLLYPALSIEKRQLFLRSVYEVAKRTSNPMLGQLLMTLVTLLTDVWAKSEFMIGERGSMGTIACGLAPFLAHLIKSITNQDCMFEMLTDGSSVELAGALGATLAPTHPEESNQNMEKIANLYSGILNKNGIEFVKHSNLVMQDILTVGKEVPVLEFARAFSNSDIDRFRKVLQEITMHKRNDEEIEEVIREFNASVKAYEKRTDRQNKMNIKGFLIDATVEAANIAMPFAGYLVGVLQEAMYSQGIENERMGRFIDNTHASLVRSKPEVILVSRMRQNLKDHL